MWDRFTETSRRVISNSEKEAERLGLGAVTSDLILLTLLDESDALGVKLLQKFATDLPLMKTELLNNIATKRSTNRDGDTRLSYATKKIIELSAEEAKSLANNYVGTEHLLLAMLRLPNETSCKILERQNINYTDLKRDLVKSTSPKSNIQKPAQSRRHKALEEFSTDLTDLAKNNKLDPCIGREKIIDRIIQILSRRTKNNPCLLGDAGVGKTAIVEGLAQRISDNEIPINLKNKKILSINIGQVLAGAKYRGEFEERFQRIIDEIKFSNDEIIIFIDEVHTLVGAGASEGSLDAANMIKPALSRGEIQFISATTNDEFKKYIETDSALERRLQVVNVSEPTIEETMDILKGLRHKYEEFHQVIISDEALESASTLSARYISNRALPDKAIDVLDEACAKVKLKLYTKKEESNNYFEAFYESQLDSFLAFLISSENDLKEDEKNIKNGYKIDQNRIFLDENHRKLDGKSAINSPNLVTPDDISMIITQWTNIPIIKLKETDSERLLNLESQLHKRIIGQHEAITSVSKAIRRSRSGIRNPKKPIGSFIFLGPTGVGKTELARSLSEYLLGSESYLIKLDMSEFMEKHSVSKLIGSPPGYIGYEEGGLLTEAVKRNPYSIILFDEIEKAHVDVFNILLQILDDGRLTDSKGKTIDFKNTVIIMTGNIGAFAFSNTDKLGFKDISKEGQNKSNFIKKTITDEMKKIFRPEFLNRVDNVIIFERLNRDEVKEITKLLLKDLSNIIKSLNMSIEFSDNVIDIISENGYDVQNGARPLKRAIQSIIEDPLSEKLLKSNFKEGDIIQVHVKDKKIFFKTKQKSKSKKSLEKSKVST